MRRKSGTQGPRGRAARAGPGGAGSAAAQSRSPGWRGGGRAGSGDVNLSRCPPGQTQALRFPRAGEMHLGRGSRGSGPEGGQDLAAASSFASSCHSFSHFQKVGFPQSPFSWLPRLLLSFLHQGLWHSLCPVDSQIPVFCPSSLWREPLTSYLSALDKPQAPQIQKLG